MYVCVCVCVCVCVIVMIIVNIIVCNVMYCTLVIYHNTH